MTDTTRTHTDTDTQMAQRFGPVVHRLACNTRPKFVAGVLCSLFGRELQAALEGLTDGKQTPSATNAAAAAAGRTAELAHGLGAGDAAAVQPAVAALALVQPVRGRDARPDYAAAVAAVRGTRAGAA